MHRVVTLWRRYSQFCVWGLLCWRWGRRNELCLYWTFVSDPVSSCLKGKALVTQVSSEMASLFWQESGCVLVKFIWRWCLSKVSNISRRFIPGSHVCVKVPHSAREPSSIVTREEQKGLSTFSISKPLFKGLAYGNHWWIVYSGSLVGSVHPTLERCGIPRESHASLHTALQMWRSNFLRPTVITVAGSQESQLAYRCT